MSHRAEEGGLLVATPNIAVDRTVRLPQLRPGEVMRPSRAVVTAGGKGLNVGRALHALTGGGSDGLPTLVGFRGRSDADLVDRLFVAEPVRFVGVDIPGEARVATVYLEQSGRVTVLNEPGAEVTADDWVRYEQAVAAELATGRHETLVCAGSLPPGAPDDAYARMVHIGHRAGARVVVDAARSALAGCLSAGPDVVAPNLAEAEGILSGHVQEAVDDAGLDVPQRARAAVRALCERGARSAAVTAGAAGVAYGELASRTGKLGGELASRTGKLGGELACRTGKLGGGDVDRVVWVPTLEVSVVNPIGAGDSFVAGLVYALEDGSSPVQAVTLAVAAATASVEQERAGGLDPRRVREIVNQLSETMVDQ